MSNSNTLYFSATQIQSELFWKFPKFLLENPKYRDLSNDDRVAYMLIRDRLKYSLSQNWVDENGFVYLIYTRDELKDELHVGKNKIAKIKRNLVDVGLLDIKKQGFNAKKKQNLPDLFYLKQPDYVVKNLISQTSQMGALDTIGRPKTGRRGETAKTLVTKGFLDSEKCYNRPSTLDTTGRPKTGQYKDKKYILDTIKDTTTDTWNFDESNFSKEKVALQNNDLIQHIDSVLTEDTIPMFLSQESVHLISTWFNTPQQVHDCISTILNASNDSKKDALEQTGQHKLDFEAYDSELKDKVTQKLRRYFNRMRTAKSGEIRDPKGYLYASMRNLFDSWQNRLMMEEKKE